MYTSFQLIVVIVLTAVVTAAVSETLHWLQDRKKERK